MYKLLITAKAKKELKQITKTYQQRALQNALYEIRDNPFIGKPLVRELTGRFTHRVGTYRIIYRIRKKDKVILIITAGHRSSVYRR